MGHGLGVRQPELVFRDGSIGDRVRQGLERPDVQVVPEVGIRRMQRRVVGFCPFQGRRGRGLREIDLGGVLQGLEVGPGGCELLLPPLLHVGRRRQGVVVFDEFPVVHEVFPEVEDLDDAVAELERGIGVVDPTDFAGREFHRRPFDRVDRDDAGCLPRTLDLELGSGREKVVHDMHRRRMDTGRREAVIARPPVAEPEPPRFGRMGEHWAPGDEVPEVFSVRFQPILIVA